MVEQVKELGIKPEADFFRNLESLAYVEVRPFESWRSKGVPSRVTILTVLHASSWEASVRSGIDHGLERIGVQPLNCPRLRYARNVGLGIGVLSRNKVCV